MKSFLTRWLAKAALIVLLFQHSSGGQQTVHSQQQAIDYLRGRGNFVEEDPQSGGFRVLLVPDRGGLEITKRDIEAVNALQNVVAFRIIAFKGISPEVFKHLKVLPDVKLVAVHYQMPAASIAYFDRFPNVEEILFWADHFISCDHLPALPKLRVLHHESTKGKFSVRSAQRIAACPNLEEVRILRPVPEQGIAFLRALPKVRYLEIAEQEVVNKKTKSE